MTAFLDQHRGGLVRAVLAVVVGVVALVAPSAGVADAATAPVVTALAPSSGPTTGGTVVTITGSGFTGATRVAFATTSATFTVINDTTIEAVAPRRAAGVAVVRVTTPAGRSPVTAAAGFTYTRPPAPFITSITPAAGPTAGGTTVVVTGTGFTGATSVTIGGRRPLDYTIDSATQITLVTPFRRVPGPVNIRITGPGGTSAITPASKYTYQPFSLPPTITGISPAEGPEAGGTTVTITGTGFTGATTVTFDTTPASAFTVVSPTEITATTPPGTGTVNVTVTTPAGTTSPVAYTYLPPQAPVAVDDPITVAEDDTPVTVDVVGNDTNPDTVPTSIASVTQPANGTVAITNNGADLTYQPDPGYCNDGTPTDEFTYTLAPGGSTATVAVTVTCVNDAPTIDSTDTVTIPENQTSVIDVDATDPDGDSEGNGLTYTITGGDDETLFTIDTDTGELTFTTPPDFENPDDTNTDNTYQVTVTVTDTGALTDTQTITVTVTDEVENTLWARSFGGTADDLGQGVAVDANGNTYTTGFFRGTVDFDPGPGTTDLTSNGSQDVFVTKLDPDGDLVWARSFGGTSTDQGNGVAVDATGNTYTTGLFSGTVDFDPGSGTANLISNGSFDVFITKLDPNGDLVWARSLGGTNSDLGLGVAVDATGNTYTTGFFADIADFDPGSGATNLTSNGSVDVFITKLDPNGNLVWARNLGGTDNDQGRSVTVDATGNTYTTGLFRGTADFDPGPGTINLTSNGNFDVFITKLDPDGDLAWARNFGGFADDQGLGVAVDATGNTYTTGVFFDTVDFDPGPGTTDLTSNGSVDVFITKLDPDGDLVWARSFGGNSFDQGRGVAVDAAGSTYTTGVFSDTADFDPGTGTTNLTSNGGSDAFVTKLDPNGDLVWVRNLGGTSIDVGYGVAVDATGNTYTTGSFAGTADFDPGPGTTNLTSNGSNDVFVTKLDPDGNLN